MDREEKDRAVKHQEDLERHYKVQLMELSNHTKDTAMENESLTRKVHHLEAEMKELNRTHSDLQEDYTNYQRQVQQEKVAIQEAYQVMKYVHSHDILYVIQFGKFCSKVTLSRTQTTMER